MEKKVGLITIHAINNFGSLLQAYATQKFIMNLGYKCDIINYQYPNSYHFQKMMDHPPYVSENLNFFQRVRLKIYRIFRLSSNLDYKSAKYKEERERLLIMTKQYETKEALMLDSPAGYDIYVTGSDQVWNPRYLYDDTSFLLPFVKNRTKIAFSASFGQTYLDDEYKLLIQPLLSQYKKISTREKSGVRMVHSICDMQAVCTCDPTLLLNSSEWYQVFNDAPLIKGKYILCYILTYTANPYPYAYKFVKYIQRCLKLKVVFIDETGRYWGDFRVKSMQRYGPREIVNLFQNASFIISSSFHGAAFSLNFRKDFYSIFPSGVNDERQESLLAAVGALDRLIRVGDNFPPKDSIIIKSWEKIAKSMDDYVSVSKDYLKSSLEL